METTDEQTCINKNMLGMKENYFLYTQPIHRWKEQTEEHNVDAEGWPADS